MLVVITLFFICAFRHSYFFIVIVPLNKHHKVLTFIRVLEPFRYNKPIRNIYQRTWTLFHCLVAHLLGPKVVKHQLAQTSFNNSFIHLSHVLAVFGFLLSHKGCSAFKYGRYVLVSTGLYWSFIYLMFNLSLPLSIIHHSVI